MNIEKKLKLWKTLNRVAILLFILLIISFIFISYYVSTADSNYSDINDSGKKTSIFEDVILHFVLMPLYVGFALLPYYGIPLVISIIFLVISHKKYKKYKGEHDKNSDMK